MGDQLDPLSSSFARLVYVRQSLRRILCVAVLESEFKGHGGMYRRAITTQVYVNLRHIKGRVTCVMFKRITVAERIVTCAHPRWYARWFNWLGACIDLARILSALRCTVRWGLGDPCFSLGFAIITYKHLRAKLHARFGLIASWKLESARDTRAPTNANNERRS